MKTILYTLFFIAIGCKATAQITLIPDPKFEQFLINEGIDSDGVINGQIFTSDALSVTNLYITSVDWDDQNLIQDVTGLEAFINLDSLSIQETNVGGEMGENTLNLSTLTKLKYFYSGSNNLKSIDFSNNNLLEVVWLNNGGNVYPIDMIKEIDLSNNPNIHTVRASLTDKINLKNGNNNENMNINVSCDYYCAGDYPPGTIVKTVCIEVDNAELAIDNQYPYSEWTVFKGWYVGVNYTDNLGECVLSKPVFSQSSIKIYPNPVNDMLYFSSNQPIEKVTLTNMLGQQIDANLSSDNKNLDMSNLPTGNYSVKITIEGVSKTIKVVKQ